MPVSNIIDLDLSVTNKKKFRINGDDNRILELNTSDISILNRMSAIYPKLQQQQVEASKLVSEVNIETEEDLTADKMSKLADALKMIDTNMRNLIDELFDSNVSEIVAPDGSMYDPFNGTFRFEHIITTLINQYESNLASEFTKMEKQLKKHTEKYTKRS